MTCDLLAVFHSARPTALTDPPHISPHVYLLTAYVVSSFDFHHVHGHIKVLKA